jgi:hypothetical protein
LTAKSSHKCRWLWSATLCATLASLGAAAQSNPLAREGIPDPAALGGRWNGANLERRSNCSATQNDGVHGTYAEYLVSIDRINAIMGITENAITGLSCTYLGSYRQVASPQWSGSYNCTDGKRGDFQSQSFLVTPNEMSIRLTIKLNTSETCDVDAVLGGSRF